MAAFLAAILLQNPVTIAYRPTVGSVLRLRSEWKLVNGNLTTEMASEQTRTVTKLLEGGRYVVHSISEGTTMKLGGRTIRDDHRTEFDLVFGPRGNVEQFVNVASAGLPARVAGFACFVAPTEPVAIGAGWSVRRAGSADGLPETQLDYTLSRFNKDQATVPFQFRELTGDQAQGKGTWIFDTEKGLPKSLELTLTGFRTGLGELVWYRITVL